MLKSPQRDIPEFACRREHLYIFDPPLLIQLSGSIFSSKNMLPTTLDDCHPECPCQCDGCSDSRSNKRGGRGIHLPIIACIRLSRERSSDLGQTRRWRRACCAPNARLTSEIAVSQSHVGQPVSRATKLADLANGLLTNGRVSLSQSHLVTAAGTPGGAAASRWHRGCCLCTRPRLGRGRRGWGRREGACQ